MTGSRGEANFVWRCKTCKVCSFRSFPVASVADPAAQREASASTRSSPLPGWRLAAGG